MRNRLIKAIAFLAIPFAAFAMSSNTYAEDGTLYYFGISNGSEECYFFDNHYGSITECSPEYGSFDNDTRIFTMGSSLNENTHIIIHGNSPVTIKTTRNINIAGIDYSPFEGNIILDLGDYRLNAKRIILDTITVQSGFLSVRGDNSDTEANDIVINNLIINGGKVSINDSFASKKTTMNNGELEATGFIALSNALYVNGGRYVHNSSSLNCRTISNTIINTNGEIETNCMLEFIGNYDEVRLIIEGGKTVVRQDRSNDMPAIYSSKGSIEVSGGELTVTAKEGYSGPAIVTWGGGIRITGGKTTVYGASFGMRAKNDIVFNGGTTTIHNSLLYPVYTESNITLGEKMVIMPEDLSIQTTPEASFIPIAETVTILKNGDEEDDNSDESDIKVPDTGAINSKEGSALAILAVSTAVILAIIGFGSYIKNRNKDHYVFDK